MHHKQGFLLIECCIYIAICAILTATIMRWISQTMLESGQHTAMVEKGLTNCLVCDVIARDIQSAPSDPKVWHIKPTSLAWSADEKTTIEWSLERKKLVRKEGLYDKARTQWGKHHTSTIACNVNTFTCNVHKNQEGIQAIEITLAIDGERPLSQYIRLRNGRCYAKNS